MTTPATPAKLKNGSWGARTRSAVAGGDTVTITTRAGKSWDATVERVIWSGDGIWLCATQSVDRQAPRRSHGTRSAYGESYCGYPCPVSGRRCCASNGPCHDCQ